MVWFDIFNRAIEVRNSDDFLRQIKKIKDPTLRKLINLRAQDMHNDRLPGDFVSKRPYPTKYKRYSNLYRIIISDYYRLIYTIIGTPASKVYLILAFLNHDEYDKLFGYKKS